MTSTHQICLNSQVHLDNCSAQYEKAVTSGRVCQRERESVCVCVCVFIPPSPSSSSCRFKSARVLAACRALAETLKVTIELVYCVPGKANNLHHRSHLIKYHPPYFGSPIAQGMARHRATGSVEAQSTRSRQKSPRRSARFPSPSHKLSLRKCAAIFSESERVHRPRTC